MEEIVGYTVQYRYMGRKSSKSGYLASDLKAAQDEANMLSGLFGCTEVEVVPQYESS